jgi:hypothetical protein
LTRCGYWFEIFLVPIGRFPENGQWWSVNLSESKLYIDAKLLSLREKTHFTTYIYVSTQFQHLGGQKKTTADILHRGKNLEYIYLLVCHPPVLIWWTVCTSCIHKNVTDIPRPGRIIKIQMLYTYQPWWKQFHTQHWLLPVFLY